MRYLAVAIVLAITPSAFAELVSNGSFETGTDPGSYSSLSSPDNNSTISNWNISAGTIDYIGTYWAAADGSRSLDMNGTSQGTIEQTLTTVVGQEYRLRFNLAINPDGAANGTKTLLFDAIRTDTSASEFGGQQSQSVTLTSQTKTNMGWTQYSFIFTASTTSTLLQFQGDSGGSSYGPALDQVSVLETPEPAAFLLFGAGLGGLGLWRRSQKSRAAKA